MLVMSTMAFNTRLLGYLVLATTLAPAACTFHPGDVSDANTGPPAIFGLTSIRIAPTSATLVLQTGQPPPAQKFDAYGKINGVDTKISTQVRWTSARPDVASVDGTGLAKAVGNAGGVVAITATNGKVSATAQLTVRVTGTFVADGPNANPPLPPNPGSNFGGSADASRAPQLVYPNDGVLFPPNVFGIEVHWRPGSTANTLYEIRWSSSVGDFRVYSRCQTLADGCLYTPPASVWGPIAETNRGGGIVKLTVRGTDDNGGGVGTSAAFTMSFSQDPVRGGLYYWTTSSGTGIMRWDFGDQTATMPQKFIGTDFTGGTCVGCHALSRDGTKIVASAGGQGDGRLLLFDATKAMPLVPFPLAQKSQFESWEPAGTAFVGIYTDDRMMGPSNLLMFDGNTGDMTGQIDLGGLRADHPDWSKDGNRIVFTSVDPSGSYTDQRPGHAGIAYIDRQGGGWSAPTSLVDAVDGKNHYYPAIAPDSQTLVFDQSVCQSGNYGEDCDADTDGTATLWVSRLPPAPVSPFQLGLANAPGVADNGETRLTNSFPKWAPFVFNLSEERKLLWMTVSSTRQYGLRPPPDGAHQESDKGTLIWMIGVDPNNLTTNQDPSYAAFVLPFQDITTSNHIAQWTEDVPAVVK
jgi:hypothetical protein